MKAIKTDKGLLIQYKTPSGKEGELYSNGDVELVEEKDVEPTLVFLFERDTESKERRLQELRASLQSGLVEES